ncbi:MAG TPA: CoA-transferase [Acidimicrobiia bacterium]|nr:CoA-transferase [Acidimicrobiia bacterium]
MTRDKRLTEEDVVAELRDGMTIGIGGWGSRRKPMSIVRAILRSSLSDLTVVSYGGPDIGMLCASGQARKIVYGFVSLDTIPLEPHFRAARQAGTVEAMELDEGMLQWGLRAAAMRVSFLPCRAGLGSAILEINPTMKTVVSPYDGEELVAMPALALDVALLHANRADWRGNAQYLGNDWYFDDVFAMAATRTFVSCEQVVEPGALVETAPPETVKVGRLWTDGVIEAPLGAHFTHCLPDYPRDEAVQREYAASASDPDAWAAFRARWVDVPEADYRRQAEAALT